MITLRKIGTNLEVYYSQDNFDFQENFTTLDNFDNLHIYTDFDNLEFHFKNKYGYSLKVIDLQDLFTIEENRVNRWNLIKTLVKYYDYSYSEICYETIEEILNTLEVTQREYNYIFEEIEEILNTAKIPYKQHYKYLEIRGYSQGDIFKVLVLQDELKEIWGNDINIKDLREDLYNYAYSSVLYGTLDLSFEYTVNAVNYPISLYFENIDEILNNRYELDFDYAAIHSAIISQSPFALNIKELKPLFTELESYDYTDIKC